MKLKLYDTKPPGCTIKSRRKKKDRKKKNSKKRKEKKKKQQGLKFY